MKYHIHFLAVLVILLMGISSGCNRSPIRGLVPAKGLVLLDEKPIGDVSIVFLPKTDSGNVYYATAVTKTDGSFELNTTGYNGILPGVYNVIFSKQTLVSKISEAEERKLVAADKHLPEPDIIRHVPAKYESFATSGIEVEIGPKGDKAIQIKLMPDATSRPKPSGI